MHGTEGVDPVKPKRSVDLTTGPILKQLILFILPMLASNLLQQLYHTADQVVVGQFAENGKMALAAIGATGSGINLIINLFIGLSVGANIVCANLKGGGKEGQLRDCMHTCLLLAAMFGLLVCALGQIFCDTLTRLMNCPEDIFDMATLYIRIIFCGTPFTMLSNFASGIIRAHGDTRRPMVIMSISGIINVALNLVFVLVFRMRVAGVAIATVISQIFTCIWILWILFDPNDEYRLKLSQLKLHKDQVGAVLRVGIPCGINSSVFSLANAVPQAAMNTFSSASVAGSTAATSLITLTYQVLAVFYSGCVSFAGQCYGAGNYSRIRKLVKTAMVLAVGSVTFFAVLFTFFYAPAISIYNSDPEVISAGKVKLLAVSWSYLAYAVTQVFSGCLRGMKRSGVPTAISVVCICGLRILWVQFAFPFYHSLEWLCLGYPISYIFSAVCMGIYYFHTMKQLRAEEMEAVLLRRAP